MSKTSKDRRLRGVHPSAALLPILYRHAAWNGAATSGVEQSFSAQALQLGVARSELSTQLEEDELKIYADHGKLDHEALVAAARSIWLQCFGIARRRARTPLKGFRRKKTKAWVAVLFHFLC